MVFLATQIRGAEKTSVGLANSVVAFNGFWDTCARDGGASEDLEGKGKRTGYNEDTLRLEETNKVLSSLFAYYTKTA